MARKNAASVAQMRRGPIPATRDPFINAPLTRLAPRADGVERFWISTWNSLSGALGVVIAEDGEHRIYRTRTPRHSGFYSAAPAGPQDPDGLWLWGWLHEAVHLDLSSGKFEAYDTTAPQAIMFSGMPFDQATGKILSVAFAPPRTLAVSFDVRNRRPVKVQEAPTSGHYMRLSFPNGDGTWSVLMHVPGERLVVWDPRSDALEEVVIAAEWATEQDGTTYHLLRDEKQHVYFPHRGWYDPRHRGFTQDGPRPQTEMTWFGNLGSSAVGINSDGTSASLGLWDFASGEVQPIGSIPNCHVQAVRLTASGKIVAVNLYGEFFRLDARTGALEYSRRLPTDAVGAIDCVCRIGEDRVLGTPYITQRFWETNLRTQEAADNGRVAPGFGEIMQLQKVGSKLYMAAYNGGELVEFDPNLPARFPENPRVVADPPGAMRPVGICTDGRHVFYSCSRNYGHLGSTLTRYDTRTGHAYDVLNPLPEQQIRSLAYDKTNRRLFGGTTYHADCQSCPPSTDTCYFATFDVETLQPTQLWPAPTGTVTAYIPGPVGAGRWLFRCQGSFLDGIKDATFIFDPRLEAVPSPDQLQPLPAGTREVQYSGCTGRFVLLFEKSVESWDMRRSRQLKVLHSGRHRIQRIAVDGHALIVVLPREVLVLENCLRAG